MRRLNKRGFLALVILGMALFAAIGARETWFALAAYIGDVIVTNSATKPVNATLVKVSTIISQAATTKYIWFDTAIPAGGTLASAKQTFTGYGKVHVLVAIKLTTSIATVTLKVYAYLYNAGKTKSYKVALQPPLLLSGTGIGTVVTASAHYFPSGPDLYFEATGPATTMVSLMAYATIA